MSRKTALIFIVSCLFAFEAVAQQKYALVIGNGNYAYWGRLNNPINDATDIKAALESLGFTVDYIADGNLAKMQTGVMNLKRKLSASPNSYGLFYFAGHGVETNGQNYLIPADANVRSRNMLPQLALPMQFVLSELDDAKNEFNLIILDACRNLPEELDRGGNRGLYPALHQPSGSIVVYATEPGKTAEDGAGRNSPFTAQLLQHIRTPGLEVNEVFRRTGLGVMQATKNAQIPTIYKKFHGIAYLGTRPNNRDQEPVPPPPPPISSLYDQLVNATGTVTITVTQDTELPPETVISQGSSIMLRGDTSGRMVLGSGYSRITIKRGVTLTLENITLNKLGVNISEGGMLVMNNASTITGVGNGGVTVFGTFTMNGGRIANNGGGGVYIGEGGTFTMKNGRIENNTAILTGGGVEVRYGGKFYMQGGIISGNRCYMAGGVFIGRNSIFRKTGGIIYGSDASSGGNTADSRQGHAVHLSGFFDRNINKTVGERDNISFP